MPREYLVALERQLEFIREARLYRDPQRRPTWPSFTGEQQQSLLRLTQNMGSIAELCEGATPTYVTPQVGELLWEAEPSLADQPLRETDLPVSDGTAYFTRLPGFPRDRFSADLAATEPALVMEESLLTWNTVTSDGDGALDMRLSRLPGLPRTGVLVAWISWAGQRASARHVPFLESGGLWRFGDTLAGALTTKARATEDPASAALRRQICVRLRGLWQFMQQRICARRLEHPDRAMRHRLEREPIRHRPLVEVIELRARDADRAPRDQEALAVDWSCRWIVRQHWRQQWFPSEQRHKPLLVEPYVKGPPDRPLKTSAKLFAVVR